LPNHKDIYLSEAQRYHALVSREDYQNKLLPGILSITPLHGKDVLELGAGTGRISCQIAPLAKRLIITDVSHHMLRFGKQHLERLNLDNWVMSLESHTDLPFINNIVDVVVAGWSFCYAAIDAGVNWESALERALSEITRVIRPGGIVLLIESLGTGFESPHRPDILMDYLAYLEKHGFESTWIRTDYQFKGRAEAKELTGFFFGESAMPMWEAETGVIVPECTGLWWKKFNGIPKIA